MPFLEPPRRASTQLLIAFASGVALLATFLGLDDVVENSREPRGRFASVDEFQFVMNGSGDYRWSRFAKLKRPYFEARRLMPLWTLPSGSTCYVFDERGEFVDWILDNGESNTWDSRWGQTGRTPATFEEIRAEIASRRR